LAVLEELSLVSAIAADEKHRVLLQLTGIASPPVNMFFTPMGEPTWNLIAFLRISLMSQRELDAKLHHRVPEDQIVSVENERLTLQTLSSMCHRIQLLCSSEESTQRHRILADGYRSIAIATAEWITTRETALKDRHQQKKPPRRRTHK
jgi:hypothetical protein